MLVLALSFLKLCDAKLFRSYPFSNCLSAYSCDANCMFVREKRIGAYSYLYLVETVRENGKTKQRIIRNLGRKEVVEAGGDLDRLARSATRLSQRSMILSLIEDSMP